MTDTATPLTDEADDVTMRLTNRHERLKTLCKELERRLAEAQKPRQDEVAWLVEASGPQYLYYNGWFQWTPDVHKALRFARRQDADAVAAEAPDDKDARAVEHAWMAP